MIDPFMLVLAFLAGWISFGVFISYEMGRSK